MTWFWKNKDFDKRRKWAWPYVLFCLCLVVLPLVVVAIYAFTDASGAFSLRNFVKFFSQSNAVNTLIYSFGIAMITTIVCLLLGYPAAYFMAIRSYRIPIVMVILFILPMWVNFLLRTIATANLFGLLGFPLGEGALIFGMCYDFLPFMIYPIFNSIQKIDTAVLEASQDLGATRLQTFFKVILPLSKPGIQSGIIMVFMPTVSTFAIAELLTNNNIRLFGSIIQDAINTSDMLNFGAALSLILLIFINLTTLIGNHADNESSIH